MGGFPRVVCMEEIKRIGTRVVRTGKIQPPVMGEYTPLVTRILLNLPVSVLKPLKTCVNAT